jgi:hypothetical protein
MHAITAPLAAVRNVGKGTEDQTAVFEYMLDQKSEYFKSE